MGAWGTGLFQNDIGDDIKSSYVEQLKIGKSDEEALKIIIAQNKDFLDDSEDSIDFWLSLSSVMYDYGRLTDEVKSKAMLILNSDADSYRWNEKEKKKRITILEKLKEKLNSPLPERKKISVLKKIVTEWKKNDVYFAEIKSICSSDVDGYYVFCVDNTVVWDARVKGLGDTIPVTYLKYTDAIPDDISEIDDIPFLIHHKTEDQIYYQFMWYHEGFNKIKKNFIYGGSYNFNRPEPEPKLDKQYLIQIFTRFSDSENFIK